MPRFLGAVYLSVLSMVILKGIATEKDVIGLQGDHVTLACNGTLSGSNGSAVWEKDEKTIVITDSRYTLVNNMDLKIDKLVESDAGVYTCKLGGNHLQEVNLVIRSKPDFTDLFKEKKLLAGSLLELQCMSTGSPRPHIQWYKDGKHITAKETKIQIESSDASNSSSSQLIVKEASLSDAGLYQCVSANLFGWISHEARIDVFIGPEFLRRPQGGVIGIKSKFTFECSAKGNPLPQLAWLRNSTALSQGPRFDVITNKQASTYQVDSTLIVKEATREDSGTFTCMAVNTFGRITADAKLSVLERPDPVTLRVGEVGSTWIDVEWTAGFDGNVQINEYIITYNATIFVSSEKTESTRIRLENLEPETKYRIGVAASNIIGASDVTLVYATTATEYIPSELVANVSLVTAQSATISWTRRAFKHLVGQGYGLEIVVTCDDRVVKNETTEHADPTGTHLLTNLLPFTTYEVRIREVYKKLFKGNYTEAITFTTAEDAPGAPQNVSAVGISTTEVLLLWNPPLHLNGIIREYEIQYSHLDDTSSYAEVTRQKNVLTRDQKDRRIVLDNLTAFTRYQIHVRERTLAHHWGPQSHVTVITLEDAPPKPKNARVTKLSDSSYNLTWDAIAPSEVRGVLTEYWVTTVIGGGMATEKKKIDAATTYLLLDNLAPYTTYQNTIAGVTGAGPGAFARIQFVTPEGVPSEPTSVQSVDQSSSSITLQWHRPLHENGIIVRYQILWKKLGFIRKRRNIPEEDEKSLEKTVTLDMSRRRELIEKLEPFTVYRIRVREATSKGWGPFSAFINGSTAESNPSKPLSVSIAVIADNGVTITWRKPEKPNGVIQYYLVYCWDGINLVQDFKVDKPINNSRDNYQLEIKKLESGRKYKVEVRAVNTLVGQPEEVTVQTTESGRTSNKELFPWLPLIAGCVGGIIFIALVTAAVLLCTRKKKYSEIEGGSDDMPLNGFTKNRPIHIAHLKHYVQQNHANSDHGFYTEYESIKVPVTSYTWENSQQPCNQQKNRYSNIVAYDHSRVVLSSLDNSPATTYINASFIDGYKSPRKFIATQGPLPQTIHDFWRMVWEQRSHVIVMLTKLVEDGRVKCEQYWPDEGAVTYKNLMLTAKGFTEMTDYMLRTFSINNVAEPHQGKREILHYHFTAWPDHGVPEHPTAMVMFIRHVMGSLPPKPGPIIVHCSAGVGRTGTFIVIDAMLNQIKEEDVVDVFGFVSHIRRQRNFMVQTEAQYTFIYDALLDAVICGNTEIAAQDLLSKLRYLNQQDPDTGETYLRDEFKRLEAGPGPTEKIQFVVASHSDNKMKNRFLNILPYDRNRVKLAQIVGFRGSDYINASYIDGFQKRRAFIATQAPLANTLQDFWRMVWEQNCHCIVMLTKLSEKGQERCHQYWPAIGSDMYGKIMVDNLAENEDEEYISRQFHVTHTESGKSRKVRHFTFQSWPQHGSPSSGAGMIQLIGDVQRSQMSSGNGPVIVHCSGGVGRTGAFIALCNCIERLKLEGIIDLFQTVRQLRTQRPAMVQTIDQYYFCYQALKDYLDSFDLYSNFA